MEVDRLLEVLHDVEEECESGYVDALTGLIEAYTATFFKVDSRVEYHCRFYKAPLVKKLVAPASAPCL